MDNRNLRFRVPVFALLALLAAIARGGTAAAGAVYLPLLSSGGATAQLAAQGVPWTDHAPPFDFQFGNHKDQHQQAKIVPAVSGNPKDSASLPVRSKLAGFLYVQVADVPGGVPEAKHIDCNAPGAECQIGWLMHGISAEATLVAKSQGRPQYCVGEAMRPLLEQGYTHFHWVKQATCLQEGNTYSGYLIRLTAVDRFKFFHSGSSGGSHGGSQGGGCGGEGGCSGEEGGCGGSGDDGGDCGDEGGCSGDEGGCEDEGGCSEDEGGCSGEEGGCSDEDGGCSGDDDGCSGDDGGCGGSGHEGGSGGHYGGILITPGPDPVSHANVTVCGSEP